jgi:hypothetical protein
LTLTVFTSANQRYEPFLLPYAASVLAHNVDAVVEIALGDPVRYQAENGAALEILRGHLGSRLHLRGGDFSLAPNSVRFLEIPAHRGQYVYIGDIDIIVVEEIAPLHLAAMARTGRPYSNIKRPGKERLSGLHFTEWDAYYPHPKLPRNMINHDEVYLFQMVQAKGHPIPDESETFRPLHGFHLSLNRDPRTKKNGWGGVRHQPYAEAYARFRATPVWTELAPLFDERFKRVLFNLEMILAGRFPDILDQTPPTPGLGLAW